MVLTKANAWGLLIQFILLQLNQNILRNYLWIQIAIVSCLATEIFRQKRALMQVPDMDQPSSPPHFNPVVAASFSALLFLMPGKARDAKLVLSESAVPAPAVPTTRGGERESPIRYVSQKLPSITA